MTKARRHQSSRTTRKPAPQATNMFDADQIANAFFDIKLTLSNQRDDEQYIRVKFDDDVKKLLRNTLLGLQSSRQIIPEDQISAMHPMVRSIREAYGRYYARLEAEFDAIDDQDDDAAIGYFEEKSFEVPSVKEARSMLARSMSQWQQDAYEDALKVCILHTNFVRTPTKVNGRTGYKIGFASHVPPVTMKPIAGVDVDQDDWDKSVVENGFVPLPRPTTITEVDARIGLMESLFEQYPIFAIRLNQVFGKLIDVLSALAHGDTTLEIGDMDEIGFHFVGMDEVMAGLTVADADDDNDDGGQGTPVTALREVAENTGDQPQIS